MFILSNLIYTIAKVISVLLSAAYWLILIRAIISWFRLDPYHPIVQFLHRTTEPLLEPIRRRLPMMGVDISPIIAFLAIIVVQSFLVRTLYDLAFMLKG